MDVPIGDEKETIGKDQSTLEMVAYRDMWGKGTDSYLHRRHRHFLSQLMSPEPRSERLVLRRRAEGGGNGLHIGRRSGDRGEA